MQSRQLAGSNSTKSLILLDKLQPPEAVNHS